MRNAGFENVNKKNYIDNRKYLKKKYIVIKYK